MRSFGLVFRGDCPGLFILEGHIILPRPRGLSDPRTNGPADYRTRGLTDPRTIGPADYRTRGLTDPRTIGPADYRDVP